MTTPTRAEVMAFVEQRAPTFTIPQKEVLVTSALEVLAETEMDMPVQFAVRIAIARGLRNS